MATFQYSPSNEKKGFPKGETFSFTNSVAYAEGSIVSKILLRNDKGNITMFSFDEGESLSEHTAPFDALVHIFDGEAEIIIDGVSHRVQTGESILMPANIPHAVKANVRMKMLLTMIKG
ncbi:MAG: cupin domain-containing protein [Paludibacter sp.]|jgi:quercetin dioxygenase-like cupin family protein|nr:cupin domain-containing protein [Paludibacter sp.]